MTLLKDDDWKLIESLEYDREATPVYDEWMDSLVWEDEWPIGLSAEAYDTLMSLVTARSLMHDPKKRERLSALSVDVDSLSEIWDQFVQSRLKWPGFERTFLTVKEQEYLTNAKVISRTQSLKRF